MKIFWILLLFCLSGHAVVAWTERPEQEDSRSVFILNTYTESTIWSSRLIARLDSLFLEKYPDIQVYKGNLNCNEICTVGSLQMSLRAALWQMAEQKGEIFDAATNLMLTTIFPRKVAPDIVILVGAGAEAVYKSVHLVMGKWKLIPIISCAVLEEQPRQNWSPDKKTDFRKLEPNLDIVAASEVEGVMRLRREYVKYMKSEAAPQDCVRIAGSWYFKTRLPSTKIFARLFVKENLEMMKRLMPDTREIIWVDDSYLQADYALYQMQEHVGKIFPQAEFKVITHNKLNTDSIYNIMMEPVKDRFFVTYSWNIDGQYSIRPEKMIDSMLRHVLPSPILTLTERNLQGNNYWLGGVHVLPEEYAGRTFRVVEQVLGGVCVDSIPVQVVTDPEIHLNMTAVKRFGLDKHLKELEGKVILMNIPPTFYERYERQILGTLIGMVILIALFIFMVRKRRFSRFMKAESENYQRLYEKLQTIYQCSSLNFALYDGQGELLFRVIYGQKCTLLPKENELFTRNLFSNPYLSREVKNQLRNSQPVNCEVEIILKNLGKQFFHVTVEPLESGVYGQACYMVIATDLSSVMQERQAKREMEHMFNYISESAQIGVAIYNLLNGEGLATSRWYENLNEAYQEGGILPLYNCTVPKDREQLIAYQNKVKQEHVQEPFARDIRVVDKEKKTHWVREYIFTKRFAPQKGEILVIELNMNVDEQKQKEAKLTYLKEQAEISNLETQQFLTNISHEIRTPLNAIVGFASLLETCDDPVEMAELTPIIDQNNRYLVALIDNILHLSKIDSGTLNFQYSRLELLQLFKTWEAYTYENISDKSLSVFVEWPAGRDSICTDPVQLDTVMKNLISNAIKFTETGKITLGYQCRQGKHYLYVKDTGIGIPREENERIFKRFEKLDSFTQGTGLGLALCQSIVTHLGGRMGVESELGEGSLFWVILPDHEEE